MAQRNTLYRFFDSGGSLLYIGISMTPWERFRQHRQGKPWWDDIANVTMEHYPSRPDVLEAERAAIITEKPLHNIQHNRLGSADVLRESIKPARLATVQAPELRVQSLYGGHVTVGEFRLVYEVELDPISDNYYWDDLDPRSLFLEWHRRASRRYGDGYVPISWFVDGPGVFEGTYEGESLTDGPSGRFLQHYSKPVDSGGNVVELSDLPVINKRWDREQCDKGGFLPVATGWTPFAMQRDVSLRLLRNKAARRRWAFFGSDRWELVAS